MTFTGTYYLKRDTPIEITGGTLVREGRMVIAVLSEDLTIQANCWEHMQRLVDVLEDGIECAKRVEEDAAAATGRA